MSIAALAVPFVLALLPIIWLVVALIALHLPAWKAAILLPIIWLVVALIALHLPAWKAAIGSFVIACGLALTWWGMSAIEVATASIEGFVMALWPIVLVIIAAVFTYNLCLRTGAMDVIGSMISYLSRDRRSSLRCSHTTCACARGPWT